MDWINLRIETRVGCYELGNELSPSMKSGVLVG
jgi:hypothetical protein